MAKVKQNETNSSEFFLMNKKEITINNEILISKKNWVWTESCKRKQKRVTGTFKRKEGLKMTKEGLRQAILLPILVYWDGRTRKSSQRQVFIKNPKNSISRTSNWTKDISNFIKYLFNLLFLLFNITKKKFLTLVSVATHNTICSEINSCWPSSFIHLLCPKYRGKATWHKFSSGSTLRFQMMKEI